MKKEHFTINAPEAKALKEKLMHYLHRYKSCILLDSSSFYSNKNLEEKAYHHSYEWIIAAGNSTYSGSEAMAYLSTELDKMEQWKFLGIAYDVKNELENLSSNNPDNGLFSSLFALSPDVVVTYNALENQIAIYRYNFEVSIFDLPDFSIEQKLENEINITPHLSKKEYIDKMNGIQQHLQRGDIYEINFCQIYSAVDAEISPYATFQQLNKISPMPFSAYFKLGHQYVLSASPERFLKKSENRLISQPMKGTIKRTNIATEDAKLAEELRNSKKDQTENVMIVDLVRNDLSRVAVRGSVQVDELFEVYEFPNIYQMISTISCQLKENTTFADIIKATFPMGSMTGAPKIRAMEIAEEYENFKRGWYAGSIGYITPENDFDFSVLIRTIFYNEKIKTLHFSVGGAITISSEAESEYEECLLKAAPLFRLFE